MVSRVRGRCVLPIVLLVALTGCGSAPELTARQASIAAAAERAADLDSADQAGEIACWSPANHTINSGGTEFRILCRVHFEQATEARFRDVICVGDLALEDPVSECYRWAYYSDTPGFEDAPPWTPGADG